MQDNSKGKIFLASDRGHTETSWFRSYNTFNFGQYQNEHKGSFRNLYVLNDDTLAGGKSFQLTVEEDSFILLLPIVGAVHFKDDTGNESLIEAGQSQCSLIKRGITITITNPFEDELINFLQIWIKAPRQNDLKTTSSFAIDENKNQLLNINSNAVANCFMGKYDGRKEGEYKPASSENGVFVFIIQGAFEVQNRLLEARDGLALWDSETVEFEPLSSDAIILVIELPKATSLS